MLLWTSIIIILFTTNSYIEAQTPSPPKFPETFCTNYTYLFKNSTDEIHYTGIIAEDNENELFTTSTVTDANGSLQTLYNRQLFYVTSNQKGTVIQCVCFFVSYSDVGCPYFQIYQHFELFKENSTDIFWKVTDIPLPPGVELLFRVKRVTPNIPAELIDLVHPPAPHNSSLNITYVDFKSSAPDPSLFAIPDRCKNIECKKRKENEDIHLVYNFV